MALLHGCFPGTPVASPSIERNWAEPPVWIDCELLDFLKELQCCGKGEPSDYTSASAIIAMHERIDPDLAKLHNIALHPLTVKQCARYLSAALKAKGALDMQLEHDVKCAAHPPDQPGHQIANCPICAEGADAATLEQSTGETHDAGASTSGEGPPHQLVRPVNVRSDLLRIQTQELL